MAPSTPDQRKKPHHHGDLRHALVDAGLALLAQGGPDALTLRRCAARAGVSHAAPAHHFDGLSGLKDEIAMQGFVKLRQTMRDHAAKAEQTPQARLRAICRGYLVFATGNRALFQLMFGFEVAGMHEKGMPREIAVAYDELRETCAALVPAGVDPVVVEIQVWSLIHGYTSLALSGRFRQADGREDTALFDNVMALLAHVGGNQS
jgi:AcrR family transcriptional regulator